jgi:membrane-bound metal-dependent hydrolase YbcI (DUF457 family)
MHPDRAWPFLSDPHYPTLSAVWAVLVHGAISLGVVLPIVLASNRRMLYGSLAFIGGPALDLDHVVAAGSLRPRTLETLNHRPVTHSLLFAVVLTLLTYALTRSKPAAWSAFAVIVSHLLFDAAGGNEYWLYPFQHPSSIPWLACPLGLAVLLGISAAIARRDLSPPNAHPIDEHLGREVRG